MDYLIVAAVFFLAGSVKGVVGLGLPTIALGFLTATIGLHPAMALILIPSFATNLLQACTGGHGKAIISRTWPFLTMATVMIGLGSFGLNHFSTQFLSSLLGIVIMLYAAIGLRGREFNIHLSWEWWAGPTFGTANGILTGLTGSSVVPGAFYLQSIGLSRDELIQALGILFTLSTVGLALSLEAQNILNLELGLLSAFALLPAVIGMLTGQRIRKKLSQATFRRVFYIFIFLLGLYILLRNMLF